MKQLASGKRMENDCFPRTLKFEMHMGSRTSNLKSVVFDGVFWTPKKIRSQVWMGIIVYGKLAWQRLIGTCKKSPKGPFTPEWGMVTGAQQSRYESCSEGASNWSGTVALEGGGLSQPGLTFRFTPVV
jgi:hypothetical protein